MAIPVVAYTLIIIAAAVLVYAVVTGYNNFGGITLQLDDYYTDVNEMASAALSELKNQGRQCEIIEARAGEYPKFLVDGSKYVMIYRMASVARVPVQVIHLKRIYEH